MIYAYTFVFLYIHILDYVFYVCVYNHNIGIFFLQTSWCQLTHLQDPPELIEPNKVMVFEGLHPIYDEKVAEPRGQSESHQTGHVSRA